MSVQDSFNKLISLAIRREEEAYEFYKEASKNADLASSAKLLEKLAQQEVGHKKKLENALQGGVCDTFTCKTVAEVEETGLSEYLVEVPIDSSSSPQDILVVAMKREEASFNFYQALSELTTDTNNRTVFETLAEEEQEHKEILEEMYDKHFQQWM